MLFAAKAIAVTMSPVRMGFIGTSITRLPLMRGPRVALNGRPRASLHPLYELDFSLVRIDRAHHLVSIYRHVALTEGHRTSGPGRRFDGELVSFEHSVDDNRV